MPLKETTAGHRCRRRRGSGTGATGPAWQGCVAPPANAKPGRPNRAGRARGRSAGRYWPGPHAAPRSAACPNRWATAPQTRRCAGVTPENRRPSAGYRRLSPCCGSGPAMPPAPATRAAVRQRAGAGPEWPAPRTAAGAVARARRVCQAGRTGFPTARPCCGGGGAWCQYRHWPHGLRRRWRRRMVGTGSFRLRLACLCSDKLLLEYSP